MILALAFGCSPDSGPPKGTGTPPPSETGTSPTTTPYPDDVLAFVGVDVLTMRAEGEVLEDRTVVVHDGRILDVVPADTPLPDGATTIDGAGRTLMPGLIDAHAHLWFDGELTLLLANGVTAARVLFGDPLQRGWRDEIAAGTRLGPQLVVAGPIVDGSPPLWPTSDVVAGPEGAAAVVGAQADAGYDLIKVYNVLGADAYRAVLDAAGPRGIPVAGHVPWEVGWDEVVAGPQVTIEHFDGLVDRVGGTGTATFLYDADGMNAAMDARDDDQLRLVAQTAADDGVFLVPTAIVVDRFMTVPELEEAWYDPVLQYVHPAVLLNWATIPPFDDPTITMLDRYALELLDYTAAFHEAGAPVALGTDSNNPFVVPGFSVHEELELLVRAGLTPYEALMAGTVTAAAAIGLQDAGTVEVGQRADLLLLAADPTVDVSAAAERVGVTVGGQWLEEAELQQMLADLAASYAGVRAATPPQQLGCRH